MNTLEISAAAGTEEAAMPAGDNPGAGGAAVMRTILIVDDQKSVVAALAMHFGDRGHTIVTAESGAAALALLDHHAIEVALVDLHMPGMDGTQVCRQLLAHAAARGQPRRVWMMSAAFTREVERRCREAGAIALLRKPFDCDALAAEIERG